MNSSTDKKGQSEQDSIIRRADQTTGAAPTENLSPDVQQAHQQAEDDIASDLETSAHSPNDDLDEGELARLGEDPGPVE